MIIPSSKGPDAETDFSMQAFFIINNFTHDLFTGLWTSAILVIYLLSRKANAQALLAAELYPVIKLFFWLVIFSLAMVIGTGLIRFIYYRPVADGSERIKKSLLIYKHFLLGTVFIGGTFLAYRWTF
jgi:NhaP-type Na+/H+ and K+/H+ antiporter